MKTKTIRLLVVILIISININSTFAQSTENLDGNSYAIVLKSTEGRKGGFNWKKDILIFAEGEMVTKILGKREGFASAIYGVSESDENAIQSISFKYNRKNKHGSTLEIEGSVNGKNITGNAIWTNVHGPHFYSFEGVLI